MLRRIVRAAGRLTNFVSSELRKAYIRRAYAVTFGSHVTVERGAVIRTFDGGSVVIGAGTHVWQNAVIEAKAAPITIGARSLINTGVFIGASFGISIGADALIAEYVTIRDADHAFDDPEAAINTQGMQGREVLIGDGVWLAAKVTVTKGVSIGARSIVGANSVVTRPIGAGEIHAGAPARPIGSRAKPPLAKTP